MERRRARNIVPALFLVLALAAPGLASCQLNTFVTWSGKYCPDAPCKDDSTPINLFGTIKLGEVDSCPPTVTKDMKVDIGKIVFPMKTTYYLLNGSCKLKIPSTPIPKPIP